jgi:hypothetical protein
MQTVERARCAQDWQGEIERRHTKAGPGKAAQEHHCQPCRNGTPRRIRALEEARNTQRLKILGGILQMVGRNLLLVLFTAVLFTALVTW